jgi:hypothetical protein
MIIYNMSSGKRAAQGPAQGPASQQSRPSRTAVDDGIVKKFDIEVYHALMRRLGCKFKNYPQFKEKDDATTVAVTKGDFFRSKVKSILMVKGIVDTWPDPTPAPAPSLSAAAAADPNAGCVKKIKDFIIGMFSESLYTTEGNWNSYLDKVIRTKQETQSREVIEERTYPRKNAASLTIFQCQLDNHNKANGSHNEYKHYDSPNVKDSHVGCGHGKPIVIITTRDRTPYFTGSVLGHNDAIHLYGHLTHRLTMFNGIDETNKLLNVCEDFIMHRHGDIDFNKTKCEAKKLNPSPDYNHGHIRAAGKFELAFQSFRVFIDTYRMLLFSGFPLLYDAIKSASDAINTETIFESTSKNATNIEDNGSIGMFEAMIIRTSAFFLCFYHNLITPAHDDSDVSGRINEICEEIDRFKERLLPYNRFFYNSDGTNDTNSKEEYDAENKLYYNSELSRLRGDIEIINDLKSLGWEEIMRKTAQLLKSASIYSFALKEILEKTIRRSPGQATDVLLTLVRKIEKNGIMANIRSKQADFIASVFADRTAAGSVGAAAEAERLLTETVSRAGSNPKSLDRFILKIKDASQVNDESTRFYTEAVKILTSTLEYGKKSVKYRRDETSELYDEINVDEIIREIEATAVSGRGAAAVLYTEPAVLYTERYMKCQNIADICNNFLSRIDSQCNPLGGDIKEMSDLNVSLEWESDSGPQPWGIPHGGHIAGLIQEILGANNKLDGEITKLTPQTGAVTKPSSRASRKKPRTYTLADMDPEYSQKYMIENRDTIAKIRGIIDRLNFVILDDYSKNKGLEEDLGNSGGGGGGPTGTGSSAASCPYIDTKMPKWILEFPSEITHKGTIFCVAFDGSTDMTKDAITANFSLPTKDSAVDMLYRNCAEYTLSAHKHDVMGAVEEVPEYHHDADGDDPIGGGQLRLDSDSVPISDDIIHRPKSNSAKNMVETYFTDCSLDITYKDNIELMHLSMVCQKSFIDFYREKKVKDVDNPFNFAQKLFIRKDGNEIGIAVSRFQSDYHRAKFIQFIQDRIMDIAHDRRGDTGSTEKRIEMIMGGLYILQSISTYNVSLRDSIKVFRETVEGKLKTIRINLAIEGANSIIKDKLKESYVNATVNSIMAVPFAAANSLGSVKNASQHVTTAFNIINIANGRFTYASDYEANVGIGMVEIAADFAITAASKSINVLRACGNNGSHDTVTSAVDQARYNINAFIYWARIVNRVQRIKMGNGFYVYPDNPANPAHTAINTFIASARINTADTIIATISRQGTRDAAAEMIINMINRATDLINALLTAGGGNTYTLLSPSPDGDPSERTKNLAAVAYENHRNAVAAATAHLAAATADHATARSAAAAHYAKFPNVIDTYEAGIEERYALFQERKTFVGGNAAHQAAADANAAAIAASVAYQDAIAAGAALGAKSVSAIAADPAVGDKSASTLAVGLQNAGLQNAVADIATDVYFVFNNASASYAAAKRVSDIANYTNIATNYGNTLIGMLFSDQPVHIDDENIAKFKASVDSNITYAATVADDALQADITNYVNDANHYIPKLTEHAGLFNANIGSEGSTFKNVLDATPVATIAADIGTLIGNAAAATTAGEFDAFKYAVAKTTANVVAVIEGLRSAPGMTVSKRLSTIHLRVVNINNAAVAVDTLITVANAASAAAASADDVKDAADRAITALDEGGIHHADLTVALAAFTSNPSGAFETLKQAAHSNFMGAAVRFNHAAIEAAAAARAILTVTAEDGDVISRAIVAILRYTADKNPENLDNVYDNAVEYIEHDEKARRVFGIALLDFAKECIPNYKDVIPFSRDSRDIVSSHYKTHYKKDATNSIVTGLLVHNSNIYHMGLIHDAHLHEISAADAAAAATHPSSYFADFIALGAIKESFKTTIVDADIRKEIVKKVIGNLSIAPNVATNAAANMYTKAYNIAINNYSLAPEYAHCIAAHWCDRICCINVYRLYEGISGYQDNYAEGIIAVTNMIDKCVINPIKLGHIHIVIFHLIPFLCNYVLRVMENINVPIAKASMSGGAGEYIKKEISLILSDFQSALPKKDGIVIELIRVFLTIFIDNSSIFDDIHTSEFVMLKSLGFIATTRQYTRYTTKGNSTDSNRSWIEREHNLKAKIGLLSGNDKLMQLIMESFSVHGFSIWSLQRKIVAMFSRLTREINVLIADTKQDTNILDLLKHIYSNPLRGSKRLTFWEASGLYSDPPFGYDKIASPDENITFMESFLEDYTMRCHAFQHVFENLTALEEYFTNVSQKPAITEDPAAKAIALVNITSTVLTPQEQIDGVGQWRENQSIIGRIILKHNVDHQSASKCYELLGDTYSLLNKYPLFLELPGMIHEMMSSISTKSASEISRIIARIKVKCLNYIYIRIKNIEYLISILLSFEPDQRETPYPNGFNDHFEHFLISYNRVVAPGQALKLLKIFPLINVCGKTLYSFGWVERIANSDGVTYPFVSDYTLHLESNRKDYDEEMINYLLGTKIHPIIYEQTSPSLYRSLVGIVNSQISTSFKVNGDLASVFENIKTNDELIGRIIDLINEDYSRKSELYQPLRLRNQVESDRTSSLSLMKELDILRKMCSGFCSGLYQLEPVNNIGLEQEIDYNKTISFMNEHRNVLINYIGTFIEYIIPESHSPVSEYMKTELERMGSDYRFTGIYGELDIAIDRYLYEINSPQSNPGRALAIRTFKWFIVGWNTAVNDALDMGILLPSTGEKIKNILTYSPVLKYFIGFVNSKKIKRFVRINLFGFPIGHIFVNKQIEIYIIGRLCGKIFGQLLYNTDNPMHRIQCVFDDIENDHAIRGVYLLTNIVQDPPDLTDLEPGYVARLHKNKPPYSTTGKLKRITKAVIQSRIFILTVKELTEGKDVSLKHIDRIENAIEDADRGGGGSGGGGGGSSGGERRGVEYGEYGGGGSGGGGYGNAARLNPYRGGSIRKLGNKSIMKPRKMSKCKNNKYKRVKTRRKLKSKRKNKRYKKVKTIRNIKRK